MRRIHAALVITACAAAACTTDRRDPVDVEVRGVVTGLVWVDRNANESRDGGDGPAEDARVVLRRTQTGPAVASGVTAASGEFIVRDVPVGDYTVTIDGASVGDSLSVLRIDSARVRVIASDTPFVEVALTYPSYSLAEARTLPEDTRIRIEAVLLNRWTTFGDSTFHLRDSSGALRVVRFPSNSTLAEGDSVRFLATTTTRTGQVVFKDALGIRLEPGAGSPEPVIVSTMAAADAGTLDAELVRISGAVIQDTVRIAGEFVIVADDGSGAVNILLDRDNAAFDAAFRAGAAPGAVIDATGLLVPREPAGDMWLLKPRAPGDIDILPI